MATKGATRTRETQEIREGDVVPFSEVVTDVKPKGAIERLFLKCTADTTVLEGKAGCTFETKRYPTRDRRSAEIELAKHQVTAHAEEKRVRVVTKREEETIG